MERLDLVFINNTANKTTFEIFNSFNTFAQVTNKDYVTPLLSYKPFATYPPPLDIIKMKGAVIFNQYGDLLVLDDTNGNIAAQIQCITYPYRSCLNALFNQKILIKKINIATSSDTAQLIAPIVRIETQPLTNKFKQDYYPVTISPFVVQPLLNEFIKDIEIDSKSGLIYVVYPNQIVNWTIEFEFI